MSSIRLKATFQFANLTRAEGLSVEANEIGGGTYNLGQTDTQGQIDRAIRDRRTVQVPNNPLIPSAGTHEENDPRDQPMFTLTISDDQGHSFTTVPIAHGALDGFRFVLPPSIPAGGPSRRANAALKDKADGKVPGWVFLVRKNGVGWAHSVRGLARLPGPGISPAPMSLDTILHIASMSKPICATALVAMIEDWGRIQKAITGLRTGATIPKSPFTFVLNEPGQPSRQVASFSVPTVLAPLFSDRGVARELVSANLLGSVATDPGVSAIVAFANWNALTVTPAPVVPPGHLGLLRRVLSGEGPPAYTTPFLGLIQARLSATAASVGGAVQIATGVNLITLDQLLRHRTNLQGGLWDRTMSSVPGWAEAQPDESGGQATFRLWPYVLLHLRQALATATTGYLNDNYTMLGAVIEACTETTYDRFVEQRLFSDPRFSTIRRRVVAPANAARYYQGAAPLFTGGVAFPSYTGWSAAGGFYATANQITDWMHVLRSREPVRQVTGNSPLLSPASVATLFGSTYFSGGGTDTLRGTVTSHRHNGGTSVTGGSVNGKLSILDGPGASIHTAFFAANGSLGGDAAFDPTMDELVQDPDWS